MKFGFCLGLVASSVAVNAMVPARPTPSNGNTWAVLAAGSSTYWNYRHQADICHAYQILRKHGVAPERIITLIYDDVAHSSSNPFPGQLFNQPAGPDVYAGCQVDYRADALSPSLFLNVLLGNEEAVAGLVGSSENANGKVLKSGPDDDVFVYFADHGGSGMIMFPGGAISSSDLISTLKQMHKKNMYKELVFYLDTCESGSMFTQLPTDIGVFAVSSARPDENANAIWCYTPDTIIQGKNIGACLGDAMSVGWMMDSDKNFEESLNAQFKTVYAWSMKNRCNPIPCFNMPCKYGDASIADEPIGNFQGQSHDVQRLSASALNESASAIDARDVKLELLKSRAAQSNSADDWALVKAEEEFRKSVDDWFAGLANAVCKEEICDASALFGRSHGFQATYEDCHPHTDVDLVCHKELIDAISSQTCARMSWGDYSGKYSKLLADFCSTGKTTEELLAHVQAQCEAVFVVA